MVVGRVTRLESENDPSNLFDESGEREIVVLWKSDDFGEIRVRVVLTAAQYIAANEAHIKGRFISISGTIDRVGRSWVLLEPNNFQVVGSAT